MKFTVPLGLLGLGCISTVAALDQAGVNLIGLAADASILGTAHTSFTSQSCGEEQTNWPYVDPPELYYAWRDMGFNLYRIPVAWGHIQEGLQGPLNQTTLDELDKIMEMVTSTGSTAILDIHNYARYYCAVIGQPALNLPNAPGDVTDDDFVDLWRKLAAHYKHNDKIIFELMNEPWGLSAFRWAETCKKAIRAILDEAPHHRILVAGPFSATVSSWEARSALAMLPLMDEAPDGQIIFDLHQYFDILNGVKAKCLDWGLFWLFFATVTDTLRNHGAKAMLTEFGGGPNDQCVELFENLLQYFEDNSDVWIGWTAWSNNYGDQAILPNKTSEYYTLAKVMKEFAPVKVQ